MARISQNMVGLTGRLSQPKRLRVPSLVSNSAAPNLATVVGKEEMMLQRMMVEIPLPMPCSVMSSPSHMSKTEPAVIAVTARAQSPKLGVKPAEVFAATTSWKRMKI